MNINYKDYFGKIHSLKKNLKYFYFIFWLVFSADYRQDNLP